MDQLTRLTDAIEAHLARRIRPGLAVSWVVPTRYDGRWTLDKEVVERLEQMHPGKVTAPVREAVSVRDAYTAGMPVSVYHPSFKVASDYRAAVSSIIAASTGARV